MDWFVTLANKQCFPPRSPKLSSEPKSTGHSQNDYRLKMDIFSCTAAFYEFRLLGPVFLFQILVMASLLHQLAPIQFMTDSFIKHWSYSI